MGGRRGRDVQHKALIVAVHREGVDHNAQYRLMALHHRWSPRINGLQQQGALYLINNTLKKGYISAS